MNLGETEKTAAERMSIDIDWAPWLTGRDYTPDDIQSESWVLPENAIADGLEIFGEIRNDAVHTVWLKGGVSGCSYEITSRLEFPLVAPASETPLYDLSFTLRVL